MKKRVLWVCNSILPKISQQLQMKVGHKEGWISGVLSTFVQSNDILDFQLAIAFPLAKGEDEIKGRLVINEDYDVMYYSFYENSLQAQDYDMDSEIGLKQIIDAFQPDMIHCFGTEYPHTLAAIKAFAQKDKTLISIQGLCSRCAIAYQANIPIRIQKRVTFRDVVRKDTAQIQQIKFEQRGDWEKLSIKMTGHLTGRTDWDCYWCHRYNSEAKYHQMNETLRDEFYGKTWKYDTCKKHSIFLSQADYPLKGAHYMLLALPTILEKYPDTTLNIAGNSLLRGEGLVASMKISSYGLYLQEVLKDLKIKNVVNFLGTQSAEEMLENYLSSNVFVCPSSLENSPNSLGEAMVLGMPIVAANVGGIPSMISKEEGYLYEGFKEEQKDDSEELIRISQKLADTILQVFDDTKGSILKGEAAKKKASITHDKKKNHDRLVSIYEEICCGSGEFK
ncbi:MAG: glycosyltransferase [Lachnospiraceae bacterium]